LTGQTDWKENARINLEAFSAGLKQTLENPWIDDPRIHQFRFTDFVADPVGTLKKFYEFSGKSFGPETEKAMRDYVDNNKADGMENSNIAPMSSTRNSMLCTGSSLPIASALVLRSKKSIRPDAFGR
jgi:hypothetical protein